jgi:hypothetical protein
MSGDIIIKKLETADLDQVSRFRMKDDGDKPLQKFLRRDAFKSGAANLTTTYVIKRPDAPHVLAYASIMCAEIKLEGAYPIDDKKGAERYSYQPAVRIARLAVCQGCEGQGWGKTLVTTVIGVVSLSIQPYAGCRFLIVDAKRKSVDFYRKLGFRLLDTAENRALETPLMFMDLKGG